MQVIRYSEALAADSDEEEVLPGTCDQYTEVCFRAGVTGFIKALEHGDSVLVRSGWSTVKVEVMSPDCG